MATSQLRASMLVAAPRHPMESRPRLTIASRVAFVGALAVVAAAQHWQLPRRIVSNLPDVVRGLTLDDEERLRRALGEQAEALFALRELAKPGQVLLTSRLSGDASQLSAAQLEALMAQNGQVGEFCALLYPKPWLVQTDNVLGNLPLLLAQGRDVALCVFPWQLSPEGLPGWSRATRGPGFEIWEFEPPR